MNNNLYWDLRMRFDVLVTHMEKLEEKIQRLEKKIEELEEKELAGVQK